MTNYQQWRDEFIARVTTTRVSVGADVEVASMQVADAQRMMRYATTAQRLAEVACNRELSFTEKARDASNDVAAKALAARCGFRLYIQRDPRGPVFRLFPPGAREPFEQHPEDGIPVPARGYTAKQLDAMS